MHAVLFHSGSDVACSSTAVSPSTTFCKADEDTNWVHVVCILVYLNPDNSIVCIPFYFLGDGFFEYLSISRNEKGKNKDFQMYVWSVFSFLSLYQFSPTMGVEACYVIVMNKKKSSTDDHYICFHGSYSLYFYHSFVFTHRSNVKIENCWVLSSFDWVISCYSSTWNVY